jgi:hypothetical protein
MKKQKYFIKNEVNNKIFHEVIITKNGLKLTGKIKKIK